ncbi:Aconitate hydratase [Halalkalibacter krulwichiae]|uniref:Aconitate hydratase n=1 Tax=Halalkalibacter krulwichiae TaxID=199441 RepID=A0A1X9MGL2_9BACI|nr:Aconitate hydratase [Halalkalibacter krulwichiae]
MYVYEKTLKTSDLTVEIYSLNCLEKLISGLEDIPFTKKLLLESLLRNKHRMKLTDRDIFEIATGFSSNKKMEIPFLPSRIIMQDASGLPALVDLASLRNEMEEMGFDPQNINPQIPVDLIIDHSLQVDYSGASDAFEKNLEMEYSRNEERYTFLKWAQQSFENFRVVPPASGIIHQVNLEYLSSIVKTDEKDGQCYAFPDSVIGTDSHTTMINGLGVLGWGVGGVEAEAVMMGNPINLIVPEVIGVKLIGRVKEGVTATDIALTVTEHLRHKNVIGKFVEFYGPGMMDLSLPDRTTIANMAPEYGATVGYFPVDQETLHYLKATGKDEKTVRLVEEYTKEQGIFYSEDTKEPLYSEVLEINLADIEVSISGPSRPQDRVDYKNAKKSFLNAFSEISEGNIDRLNVPMSEKKNIVGHGSIVIAAITSCTNTSNPFNMLTAGLLARNAVKKGLAPSSYIQKSLAPGSKVVSQYLQQSGLLSYFEQLGFYNIGYGCAVCVGNSGTINPLVEKEITENNLIVASILSGNRNFEGRIHPLVKANYLASPPLVLAYALAGTVAIDLSKEPLGISNKGEKVYLKDIWPTADEVNELIANYISPTLYKDTYENVFAGDERWKSLQDVKSPLYRWDSHSTYLKPSPFFKRSNEKIGNIKRARALVYLGNSITTDHISPVGVIDPDGSAGQFLLHQGVTNTELNTYGSRRGNYEVLVRGTFANPMIQNKLVKQRGSITKHFPSNEVTSIYEASVRYQKEQIPLVILAGNQYGAGSARDWAAKGTLLLGVKAVIAEQFERIHRSNLAMVGVLPLQFSDEHNCERLGLNGDEEFNILDLESELYPNKLLRVQAISSDGMKEFQVILRLDTTAEIDNYLQGGLFKKMLQTTKRVFTTSPL